MKYLIISDIHGSLYYTKKIIEVIRQQQFEKIIILGDILYHGPRNELPYDYDTKQVYELLNSISEKIIAVRGNCDSEVDDTVLEFDLRADYKVIEVDSRKWYLTHGHLNRCLPKLEEDSILFNGHSHIFELSEAFINPGSLSIPRGGSVASYIIYNNKTFSLYELENSQIIDSLQIT